LAKAVVELVKQWKVRRQSIDHGRWAGHAGKAQGDQQRTPHRIDVDQSIQRHAAKEQWRKVKARERCVPGVARQNHPCRQRRPDSPLDHGEIGQP
jgi:hypothetical protein